MLNGPRANPPMIGPWMSNAARRQSDSLGINTLASTPMFLAVVLCAIHPNSSTHPPRNARMCMPNTSTPVASVERLAPTRRLIESNKDFLKRVNDEDYEEDDESGDSAREAEEEIEEYEEL